MRSGPNPAVFLTIMAIYVVVIGLIVFFAIRWRRRRMTVRDEALARGLEASGARYVGEGMARGYYGGREREYTLAGQRLFTCCYSVSRYEYRSNLRIATPPLPGITVIPEGKVERFGKSIGLNREVQTGDAAFDDAAYVDTIEEEAPVQRIFEGAAVREGVRRLLELGYKVQLSKRGLEAFQLLSHGTPPDVTHMSEAAALLAQIAAVLPPVEPGTFRGDIPLLRSRGVLFSLLWIPALILAGLLDGLLHSPGARTLEMGHKGLYVGLAALTAWVVYVALLALRLRGRSYAFRALLVAGAMGLFGIPTCGVMGFLALNQALDSSPAEEHAVTVNGTTSYKGECRVYVASWVAPEQVEKLPVACKLRGQLTRGKTLQVRAHKGALGLTWVEPIRAADGG